VRREKACWRQSRCSSRHIIIVIILAAFLRAQQQQRRRRRPAADSVVQRSRRIGRKPHHCKLVRRQPCLQLGVRPPISPIELQGCRRHRCRLHFHACIGTSSSSSGGGGGGGGVLGTSPFVESSASLVSLGFGTARRLGLCTGVLSALARTPGGQLRSPLRYPTLECSSRSEVALECRLGLATCAGLGECGRVLCVLGRCLEALLPPDEGGNPTELMREAIGRS